MPGANCVVMTGSRVMASNVKAPTNFSADRVITATTSWPFLASATRVLATSAGSPSAGRISVPAEIACGALEVRDLLEPADRAEAEPRDGAYVGGNPQQGLEELLAVERHPADAETLGGGREPEVLDGQAGGVEAGVVDGVTCRELLDELAAKLQSKLSFSAEQGLQTVAGLLTFLRGLACPLVDGRTRRKLSGARENPGSKPTLG